LAGFLHYVAHHKRRGKGGKPLAPNLAGLISRSTWIGAQGWLVVLDEILF